jgi:Ca2+-binding EF-hand superfamily protein
MRSTWIPIIAAALAVGGPTARAEDTARKYDPRAAFSDTDLNRDGAVDREEFHRRIVEIFYAADGNKDGFLDPQELERLTFPDDFTDDDKDHDGRLSMREFLRVRFHDFDVADRDQDGVLSLDEVVAAFEGRKRR